MDTKGSPMATRRFALVTAALAALLAAGMVAPAAAEDAASVTEETRQEWREHMAGLGISSAVRNVLVEKLERGVLPDSMIDGVVRFERFGRDRKRVSVYPASDSRITSIAGNS